MSTRPTKSQVVGDPLAGVQTQQYTMHGDSAAKRQAITELLFFASVGDIIRCKRLTKSWALNVADPMCSDYDKRTPLHLAAREACWAVAEWLIEEGANINAVDKFQRTPLEEAVRNSNVEIVQLLAKKGARVYENSALVPLEESALATHGHRMLVMEPDYDIWEIDPSELQIQQKLGEGEFGVVHKASFHGTDVAVKILKDSTDIALGDFRTEITTLRQVHHPNAVQFLGACTKQMPYMLVTELMSGGSLADAFKLMNFQLSLRRALEIALDASRGMAYLHSPRPTPIIHRDLKPGNFMITGSPYCQKRRLVHDVGVVKIADFGLSKTLPGLGGMDDTINGQYEMTGETGTYRYMAPEVFRHEPYSTKVDVYAFAMLCFELFEGRAPFGGLDGIQAARGAAMQDFRPIMTAMDKPNDPVRWEIKELIERMWHREPTKRPTFQEITFTLVQLLRKAPRTAAGGEDKCKCIVQ